MAWLGLACLYSVWMSSGLVARGPTAFSARHRMAYRLYPPEAGRPSLTATSKAWEQGGGVGHEEAPDEQAQGRVLDVGAQGHAAV